MLARKELDEERQNLLLDIIKLKGHCFGVCCGYCSIMNYYCHGLYEKHQENTLVYNKAIELFIKEFGKEKLVACLL